MGRRQAGGEERGDQVIRRIINLDGSLQGGRKKKKKNSGDFQTPGEDRRKQAAAPSLRRQATIPTLKPGGSKLRKQAAWRWRPAPQCPPQPSWGRSLRAPRTDTCCRPELLRRPSEQRHSRPCTRGPGARRPWPRSASGGGRGGSCFREAQGPRAAAAAARLELNVSPGSGVCAISQTYAPPHSPPLSPSALPARPAQRLRRPLSRDFQESTSRDRGPATALKRLRRSCRAEETGSSSPVPTRSGWMPRIRLL